MNTFEKLAEGMKCLEIGDLVGAEAYAKDVLNENPYIPYAQRILLKIYSLKPHEHMAHSFDDEVSSNSPYYSDVEMRRASRLFRNGFVEEARRGFDCALNMPLSLDETRMLPYGKVTKARLKHDLFYLEYLVEKKVVDRNCVSEAVSAISDLLFDFPQGSEVLNLSSGQLISIAGIYRRCLYLADPQVPSSLVDENALRSALREYSSLPSDQKVVWFDGLFTEECLLELRRHLLLSSIWHNDGQKGAGYLGAYQDNGLRNPLIDSIVGIIEKVFFEELGLGPVEQIWCYKNIEGDTGVGVHADFSKVNLNVWLTPDVYNTMPDAGGLIVYHKKAPADWPFERYNDDHEAIASAISGVGRKIIPYRYNRAMIFDSSIFHGSDQVRFADSYEAFRINMTFLFGQR